MLTKVAALKKPQLDPPLVARVYKKDDVVTGPLVTNNSGLTGNQVTYLETDKGKYIPVREKDSIGTLLWKHVSLEPVTTPPPAGNLYRVKLDQETDEWGGSVRDSAPAPAVWVLSDTQFTMTTNVQLFCADLLALSKYGTTYQLLSNTQKDFIGSAYRGVYKYDRAFNNGTGYEEPGDPRSDWVNMRDLDSPNPKFDKIRVCSDAVISGVESGTDLIVDHYTDVPFGVSLNDHEVFRATIIYKDGHLSNFPQLKDGTPVYVPIFSNSELRIPLKYLEKL